MGFISNIKESFTKSMDQNRQVRDKIKEIEFQERMIQAEVFAKAKVEANVKKKLDRINGVRKPMGKIFAVPKGEEDKGNYNFITGKFEDKKVSVPKVTTKKKLHKHNNKTIVLKLK